MEAASGRCEYRKVCLFLGGVVKSIPPIFFGVMSSFQHYLVSAGVFLLAAKFAAPRPVLIAGFAALALGMAIGAMLAAYHAGVEWHFWPGPQECSGDPNFGRTGSLLEQLNTVIVVRCDEAAWRLFGLSLAGYNVVWTRRPTEASA